jgi:transglutaminase-like putative cysteine protease
LLWTIRHSTRYTYSAPVFLEPHVLRLTPISDASQRLIEFELKVTPPAAGRSENADLDGNSVTRVWFEERTDALSIEVHTRIESLRQDPFAYLWEGPKTLPVRYPDEQRTLLAPYCSDRILGEVGALADRSAVESGGDAQTFALTLASSIHQACKQVYREEGRPLPAAETLKQGEGSCRDLAQLFLEASRSKGFAARFVSGYVAHGDAGDRELHAWAELYMPGGGWRGFDATTGLAVGEQHVVLARSALASQAAPVQGSFRGSATAVLDAEVHIATT